jgi:hypothetical protein
MDATSDVPEPGASPRSPQRYIGVLLAGIAAALGVGILVAAAVVPVVTPQSAPATSTILPGNTPTPSPPGAPSLTALPRVTLLAHDGAAALGLAAIPVLAAFVVVLLLWYAAVHGSSMAVYTSWVLAVVLTLAAVVGFVTILIGVVVIPVGVLLIIACTQTGQARPRPHGR